MSDDEYIDSLASLDERAKTREEATSVVSRDFSASMVLLPDHSVRPIYVCPDRRIFLESWHSSYSLAYDFLVTIAEPVSRPDHLHEYLLTPFSLYAATAVSLTGPDIVRALQRMSKVGVPQSVVDFILNCTKRYGKAKLVLRDNKVLVESLHNEVLRDLLKRSAEIRDARVNEVSSLPLPALGGRASGAFKEDEDGFLVHDAAEEMRGNLKVLEDDLDGESEDDSDDEEEGGGGGDGKAQKRRRKMREKLRSHSFQIDPRKYEVVKRAAIELDYPLMEEYDFKNDRTNPNLPIELKPEARIRRYQERSLSKMFGNGRARSGIIVLPCGAGKTLTGVTATQTIKKGCIVLCTNTESVLQWKHQFQKWTTIPESRISCLTSKVKETLHKDACVVITTYSMITHSGKRAEETEKVMTQIRAREWGLLMFDEVHVAPADSFRTVVGHVKAHTKLGLTATLVREDSRILDLNFLIGPKLYEANWMDLTASGYLANVKCIEVWCPMPAPFMHEYLKAEEQKGLHYKMMDIYAMNPCKLRNAEFLVKYHEKLGHKIIIFSDNVYALMKYMTAIQRPFIYGSTPSDERQKILGMFKTPHINTIGLSKVGDTSIDLPDANVIIQISSHFGSRRQEAQRLGRILRPKESTTTDGTNRDTYNAFFYTLVSNDTGEMSYSAKRAQYLVDQGYTFQVVTNLHDTTAAWAQESYVDERESEKAGKTVVKTNSSCPTRKHELELLRNTLADNSEDLRKQENDALAKDDDNALYANLLNLNPTQAAILRRDGGLQALSGGQGVRYEVSKSTVTTSIKNSLTKGFYKK